MIGSNSFHNRARLTGERLDDRLCPSGMDIGTMLTTGDGHTGLIGYSVGGGFAWAVNTRVGEPAGIDVGVALSQLHGVEVIAKSGQLAEGQPFLELYGPEWAALAWQLYYEDLNWGTTNGQPVGNGSVTLSASYNAGADWVSGTVTLDSQGGYLTGGRLQIYLPNQLHLDPAHTLGWSEYNGVVYRDFGLVETGQGASYPFVLKPDASYTKPYTVDLTLQAVFSTPDSYAPDNMASIHGIYVG
jgi:hypothetical protein